MAVVADPAGLEVSPSLDEVRALARDHTLVLLRHTFIDDCETPVSAYLKLHGEGPSFLLESAEQGQRFGRWSFLGVGQRSVMRLEHGRLTVDGELRDHSDPYAAVAEELGRYRLAPAEGLPPFAPEFVLTRPGATGGQGRAGMLYRDLIPSRLGGRYIASHITIPDGGPVSDWVHYHRILVQMIFVRRGWVRVVYEGEGEPFVMHTGDHVHLGQGGGQLVAVTLGQAAGDGQTGPHGTGLGQLQDGVDGLLAGRLDEGARVDDDQVGGLRAVGPLVPLRLEAAAQLLRVDLVLGAAQGLEPVAHDLPAYWRPGGTLPPGGRLLLAAEHPVHLGAADRAGALRGGTPVGEGHFVALELTLLLALDAVALISRHGSVLLVPVGLSHATDQISPVG